MISIVSLLLPKPLRSLLGYYQQFTDACLDNGSCTAPFSYAARLTETILLGVIAGRFPGETLNWDREKALFSQMEANPFLDGNYRKF